MKLLFIYPNFASSLGVMKKVRSKLNALTAVNGCDVHLLIYGNQIDQGAFDGFEVTMHWLEIQKPPSNRILSKPILWPVLYESQTRFRLNALLPRIQELIPDIIVMRDLPSNKSSLTFLKKLNSICPLVLEINTDIQSELEMKADNSELGKWYSVEAKKEKAYKPKVFQSISAILPVTRELGVYATKLARQPLPSLVLSNGVQLNLEDEVGAFPDSTVIRGVFLAGTASVWNGVDRLIKSVKAYSGKQPLQIDVYGGEQMEDVNLDNVQIRFKESISADKVKDVLGNYHFGTSTLALFRKKMEEASTLKVREYLASGLPTVLAYSDTDVPNESPFVFRIQNNDDDLDFEAIIEWLVPLLKEGSQSKKSIVEFARLHLDYNVKVKEMAVFLESLSLNRISQTSTNR